MAFINWSDKLSVGVAEMDAEHQKLVALINELHTAMNTGNGGPAALEILGRVIQYTLTHFANEERLMTRCQYPKFAEHKALHTQLTQQAKQLQADVASGKRLACIQVLTFLRTWLQTHIQQEDRKYGQHIQSRKAA
jgi:hemerythrin-like metal-binding protein